MTPLVHHSPAPVVASDAVNLSGCVRKDHALAERPPRVPLLALRKTRIEWFYILDVNVKRPEELNRSEYRDIKESAIHLPATTESLVKIQRAFDLHAETCRFENLAIRYLSDNVDIIIYSICTAIKPNRR